MMWKLISSIALLGFINAIEIHHTPLYKGYAAPALIKAAPIGVKAIAVEEGPAEYEFSYSVHDPHTGDIKSQKESRKGHAVEGSYELIDSDGHRRIVQYSADEHTGFNAIVHREPTDIKIPVPEPKHIAAHKIIAPKILAAPLVNYAPQHVAKVLTSGHALHGGETHVSFVGPAVSYHY